MGVHLTGVGLMGGHLTGVCLMGMHLMGIHLIPLGSDPAGPKISAGRPHQKSARLLQHQQLGE
jgi:hypothetical protein